MTYLALNVNVASNECPARSTQTQPASLVHPSRRRATNILSLEWGGSVSTERHVIQTRSDKNQHRNLVTTVRGILNNIR